MTPQQIEALKLAFEALQFALHVGFDESSESQIKKGDKAWQQHRKAITAIKEALAEHAMRETQRLGQEIEQEPVAYLCENAVGHRYFRWKKPSSTYKPIPLYTSPPQRKPLTDEEISEIAINNPPMVHEFARAIEAAHGIKGDT